MSNLHVDLPSPHGNTDGGTDRTHEDPTYVPNRLTSGTCAGGAEPFAWSEVFEAGFLPTAERFPVVRLGEREPIPLDVRRGVYRRDGGRCFSCGASWHDYPLELDHIVPWSAGGPDTSDNLRTLCAPCNAHRSNYDDGADGKRVLPVTWWCLTCHSIDSGYSWRPEWVRPGPGRIAPREGLTFAYCAPCDINSYAEVVL